MPPHPKYIHAQSAKDCKTLHVTSPLEIPCILQYLMMHNIRGCRVKSTCVAVGGLILKRHLIHALYPTNNPCPKETHLLTLHPTNNSCHLPHLKHDSLINSGNAGMQTRM